MIPNVGAIEIDEDRNVPYQLYSFRRAVLVHCAPLLEEEKLNCARDHQFALLVPFQLFNGCRITPSQFVWPFCPAFFTVTAAKNFKQGVIFKPPSIKPAKRLESFARDSLGTIDEDLRCPLQQWQLNCLHLLKVNFAISRSKSSRFFDT